MLRGRGGGGLGGPLKQICCEMLADPLIKIPTKKVHTNSHSPSCRLLEFDGECGMLCAGIALAPGICNTFADFWQLPL